jgi:hypothetical protein
LDVPQKPDECLDTQCRRVIVTLDIACPVAFQSTSEQH